MLNRIHSPQDCLSSLWDKSFLQERGIASFFLTEKNTFENTPLFDGIFRYLLIQKGTAQITITGLEYFLKPSCLVVLAPEYYCQFTEIGSDFQGSLLLVDKSYLDTLPASDKMYRHITKVMLQQRQVNLLNQQQHRVVSESIHTIQEKLKLTHHHLKHEIIQNALVTFLLELSNIWIENHWNLLDEPYQIRYEYILKRFFDSLMQNYRREHLVPFYADQLNITTQYLSSVIKSLTGRTPSQFIFERLYCEAQALLDHPDLSIKEIAELLHFSDQSAFGKFFKKRYGQSPVDYRKRHPI